MNQILCVRITGRIWCYTSVRRVTKVDVLNEMPTKYRNHDCCDIEDIFGEEQKELERNFEILENTTLPKLTTRMLEIEKSQTWLFLSIHVMKMASFTHLKCINWCLILIAVRIGIPDKCLQPKLIERLVLWYVFDGDGKFSHVKLLIKEKYSHTLITERYRLCCFKHRRTSQARIQEFSSEGVQLSKNFDKQKKKKLKRRKRENRGGYGGSFHLQKYGLLIKLTFKRISNIQVYFR